MVEKGCQDDESGELILQIWTNSPGETIWFLAHWHGFNTPFSHDFPLGRVKKSLHAQMNR